MSIINFENVWEKYRVKFIKEGKVSWEEFCALEDINFKVEKAQVVGVIGRNGSGKTTLLKLIAGILLPDKGKVDVTGRVSMLMELGAGFNPEFTGRENIALNARAYGMNEDALGVNLEKIMAFAGLGRFIDVPVKYYSQGMYMRLAFSLAIFVEPDILLIDDILAVGDEEARQKCLKKIFELKQSGKTIILVSHDMDMVHRLCDRVILIEKGKVVREGPPEKVIPYYLETAGDKKGAAVLEKDELKIIFNNGRITIVYKDNLITKGSGIFASFFLPALNIWFSSFDLAWRIKNILADEVIAEGTTLEGSAFLEWKILLRDNLLQWEVDVKDPAAGEPRLNIFLVSDYTRWITLEKEGEFPFFAHKSNWTEIDFGGCNYSLAGMMPNAEKNTLPFAAVEAAGAGCELKLFNTGYEQEARVIQLSLSGGGRGRAEISFFSQREMFESHMARKKQEYPLRMRDDQARIRSLHTISGGRLCLFADTQARSLRLYYNGRELTKGRALHSGFYVWQRWFNSDDAQWFPEKVSEKELILVLKYEQIDVSQIWTISIQDEGSVEIKAVIEILKPLPIANRNIRLELDNEYKGWETVYENGDFSANQEVNDIIPIRLKDNKVNRVFLRPKTGDSSPLISFEASYRPDIQVLGVYKRKDSGEEFVCVNFSPIDAKRDETVRQGGRHVYFEGRINFNQELNFNDGTLSKEIIGLDNGDLKFRFDRGKGMLFSGRRELTSGLGVYTSMRSHGIWYDSYQALWRLSRKSGGKITLLGDWPHIPISQIWKIELVSENLISWEISMEIHEEVVLEIEQSNLMLSNEYKNWTSGYSIQGEFLDEYTRDYDILPFRFWYGNSVLLAAKARGLPQVVFRHNGKDVFLRSIVENTDNLYRARILQYQKANNRRMAPGMYKYFEGLIGVGDEERASKV